MKKSVLYLTGLLITCAALGALGQQLLMGNQQQTRKKFVADQLIVKFRAGTTEQAIESVNKRLGASIHSANHRGFRVMRILGGRKVEEMIAKFKADPLVEYAEPDFIAYAFAVPNDPFYPYQWNFNNTVNGGINTEAAWDITTGSPSVIVAILGTGIAYEIYSHNVGLYTRNYYKAPDLEGTQFVAGWDFINNDAHPNDDNGHETHVCGTIAQATNNGTGVAGIAFNTSIMPVKVLDAAGSGSYSQVASGIIWAADHNAKIINLSLGGSAASLTLEDACRYAYERGVTVVCAAGNESADSVSYPAAYDNYCIAVGAVRFDQTRSDYSNYGRGLDVVAPGGDVAVDQNGDGYGDGILQMTFGTPRYLSRKYYYDTWNYYFYQGTSMATPHVAGVAALLVAANVATTPDEVRQTLQSTATDLGAPGYDEQYGWGQINAAAALSYAAAPNTPPVADAGGPYYGTEDAPLAFDGSRSADAENDVLTYSWNFGDGSTGAGVSPSHTYTAGGLYSVTLVVNDGKNNSIQVTTMTDIQEVNDLPVANAGKDTTVLVGQTLEFNGSATYDIDGTIADYKWDFGNGSLASGATVSYAYTAAGTYTVVLTVTDNKGAIASDNVVVVVKEIPTEIVVFSDDFEIGQWNGLWTQDSQNDWFRSSQRSAAGLWSAEVDGKATNAQLLSVPINLQGRTNATIAFSWYIESSLDNGEYVAFEVSTNGGSTWTEKARLSGNVGPEESWQSKSVTLNGIQNLKIRFKGTMSGTEEDANVDAVTITAK